MRPRTPDTVLRAFCFPHAGGAASAYRDWLDRRWSGVEVWPVQLPGREGRYREDLPIGIADLAPLAAVAMLPHLDVPFALVGASMGGLVAFEVARHLFDRYGLSPVGLAVAGVHPPGTRDRLPPLSGLPAREFGRAMQRRHGGIPSQILEQPDLADAYLPIMRADMAMVESYRPAPGPTLSCPVTAFAGTADRTVGVADLAGWAAVTSGPFEAHELDGDHFAVLRTPDPVLACLTAGIRPGAAAGSTG